jgi:hypothetical protein
MICGHLDDWKACGARSIVRAPPFHLTDVALSFLELDARCKLRQAFVREQSICLAEISWVVESGINRLRIEAYAIGYIEHLPAQLQLRALRDGKGLIQARIPAVIAIAAQRVPRT